MLNLVFNDISGSLLLHQMYYGGAVLSLQAVPPHNPLDQVGAFWRNLDSTGVQVVRHVDDTWINEFRLRLWRVKQSVYLPIIKK